jgi:hypothetical protein
VEASCSLGRDGFGWRQSKTTGETLHEKVVVQQFPPANNWMLTGTAPEWDTMNTNNDLEMKKEVEEMILHRMAKVKYFLEMWRGSQNLRAIQEQSRAQNKQMTAVEYISDTEVIVKASWSLFQHDSVAAFKLSERSPLPPALSEEELPGGQTQMLNVRHIRRINRDPVNSDKDSPSESISDSKDWLHWNCDLDNANDSKEDWAADNDSDTERNNCLEDPKFPERQDLSATPNVPGLVRQTLKAKRGVEKVFMTVNAAETWRNKGGKKK